MDRRRTLVLVGLVLLASGAAAAAVALANGESRAAADGPCRGELSRSVPQPSPAELAAAGLDELPLAPLSARVDLVPQSFSKPTRITNPLFPIVSLHSAILNGVVDGKVFKVETTLLPGTRMIGWGEGRCVEALASQYAAYLDGRLHEVAIDYYAQADDGSVWYLGEDVFNYEDGVVADRLGSWLAGRDGAGAMIMPGTPKVGDAYRPENVPGLVFEEVRVRAVGRTVDGPRGRVGGAIVIREIHADGAFEAKQFAPGYGEFFTGAGGDVEALALAVPTDALAGGAPRELGALSAAADEVFEAAGRGQWARASGAAAKASAAWVAQRESGDVPRRLVGPTTSVVERLAEAVAARDRAEARQAAVNAAQAALDLRLQYRPVAEIDRGRFELWLRQLLVDAGSRDTSAVAGDVSTLEWIRDRIAHTLGAERRAGLDTLLVELREAARDDDLRTASELSAELRELIEEGS
jgi:hypothetical protein